MGLPFLQSGNTALTRRAKEHSRRYTVVLKWSRARKRYERQGLLVEEAALANAEAECLADEAVRQRRRQRNAERRKELDEQFVARFAKGTRSLSQLPHKQGASDRRVCMPEVHQASRLYGRDKTAAEKSFRNGPTPPNAVSRLTRDLNRPK